MTRSQSIFHLLYLGKPENTTQQYAELGKVNKSSNYDELHNYSFFSDSVGLKSLQNSRNTACCRKLKKECSYSNNSDTIDNCIYTTKTSYIFIVSCQNHVLVHDLTLDIIYVVVSRPPRYFKQRINIAVDNASAFHCCDQSLIPWLSVVVCYRVWRSPVKTCGFSSGTLTFSQRPPLANA